MTLFNTRPEAEELSPVDAQLRTREGALLIDVREDWEWRDGHAAGARNIPLATLPGSFGALPRGRELLIICASGNRSMTAARYLNEHGLTARSVAGGTVAWARQGLPVQR